MPRRRKRIDPSSFNLPVDQIKAGFYTDTYFVRSREILRAENRSPRVHLQVSGKTAGYLSGIDESIAVARELAGFVWALARAHADQHGSDQAGVADTAEIAA